MPWQTGGWNDGKNVARMLDALWFAGRIAIVGRQGRERVWDLAERAWQPLERLAGPELARRLVDQQLKANGIATADALGRAFDGVRAASRIAPAEGSVGAPPWSIDALRPPSAEVRLTPGFPRPGMNHRGSGVYLP